MVAEDARPALLFPSSVSWGCSISVWFIKIAWNRDLVDTFSKRCGPCWCTETESIDDLFSISVPCVVLQGIVCLSSIDAVDSMGKWNSRQIRKEKCRNLTWKVIFTPCVSSDLGIVERGLWIIDQLKAPLHSDSIFLRNGLKSFYTFLKRFKVKMHRS